MPSEIILRFTADGLGLVGSLHLPDRPCAPVVIGCHGLLADRSSPKQIALAQACNREGLAYFRFDHRGCGDSQGDFRSVTSLDARCRDLKAAVAKLQQQSGIGPIGALFGSSFGGTVVLASAVHMHVPALITYAAPITSAAIHTTAILDNKGRPINEHRLSSKMAFDITDQLHFLQHVFVAHGQFDEIVPVEHACTIFQLAREPKKLLIQQKGDHRMSRPDHQGEFEEQFLFWIKSALNHEKLN